MVLLGCASWEATGTTGKVTLVCGCLMTSQHNAQALPLLGLWKEVVVVPSCKPKDDGDPERCGDDGTGSCHCSAARSSVRWLWSCVWLREAQLLAISPSLSCCQQTHEMRVSCSHLAAYFAPWSLGRAGTGVYLVTQCVCWCQGLCGCDGPLLGTLCTVQGHSRGF